MQLGYVMFDFLFDLHWESLESLEDLSEGWDLTENLFIWRYFELVSVFSDVILAVVARSIVHQFNLFNLIRLNSDSIL